MVAIIKTGRSIERILNYNENKVKIGVAKCIGEKNFILGKDEMNTKMKLNFFQKQIELNERATRNSVHISLNFDPSEAALTSDKLMDIANTYMTKIGFENQPYLVYQHHDAGHPHIHIVSTKIQSDGKRIDMHNIGRNQSETARKEIEKTFQLVMAGNGQIKQNFELKPIEVSKINYGQLETKKAIATVLNAVIPNYKYTSIAELNAVLNLYNVHANQGSENSRVQLNKGLLYQLLDNNKKPIGVPIKASSFYNKPTLKSLEEKFELNKKTRASDSVRIKNTIDFILLDAKKKTLEVLEKALEKDGISMVFRKNSEGFLYGLTYVDHKTKCVFNGSALGKQYSAKAIQERCQNDLDTKLNAINSLLKNKEQKKIAQNNSAIIINHSDQTNWIQTKTEIEKILEAFTQAEFTSNYIPSQLKGKRKKKKRKGQSDNR